MAFKHHFTQTEIRRCASSSDFWRRVGWIIILDDYMWYMHHLFVYLFIYLFNLQESYLQVRPPALGSCAFPQHCSLQWTCEGTKGSIRVDCRCLFLWQCIWAVSLASVPSNPKTTLHVASLSELVLVIRNFYYETKHMAETWKLVVTWATQDRTVKTFHLGNCLATFAHCCLDKVWHPKVNWF